MFPADFDQLDQQLARGPVANFDTYYCHCMALIIGSGNRGIQSASPRQLLVMAGRCKGWINRSMSGDGSRPSSWRRSDRYSR